MNNHRIVLAVKGSSISKDIKPLVDKFAAATAVVGEYLERYQLRLLEWEGFSNLKPTEIEVGFTSSYFSSDRALRGFLKKRKDTNRLRIILDCPNSEQLESELKDHDGSHLITIRFGENLELLRRCENSGMSFQLPASIEIVKNVIFDTCLDIVTAHTIPFTRNLVKSSLSLGILLSHQKLNFAKDKKLKIYGSKVDYNGINLSTFSFAFAAREKLDGKINELDFKLYQGIWNEFLDCFQTVKISRRNLDGGDQVRLMDAPAYNPVFDGFENSTIDFIKMLSRKWGRIQNFKTLDDVYNFVNRLQPLSGQISCSELHKLLIRNMEAFDNFELLAIYLTCRRPEKILDRKEVCVFFGKSEWRQNLLEISYFREKFKNRFQSPYIICLPFRKSTEVT